MKDMFTDHHATLSTSLCFAVTKLLCICIFWDPSFSPHLSSHLLTFLHTYLSPWVGKLIALEHIYILMGLLLVQSPDQTFSGKTYGKWSDDICGVLPSPPPPPKFVPIASDAGEWDWDGEDRDGGWKVSLFLSFAFPPPPPPPPLAQAMYTAVGLLIQ